MKDVQVEIKQPDENPVPTEVLATAIVEMANGVKKLRAGRLNESALVLLVQHGMGHAKLSQYAIRQVLNAMSDLEKNYINHPKKK